MLNFISARWQALKTKYKKIIPFVLTFIFCFSPLSVSAAEVSPDAQNEWFLLPFNYFDDYSIIGEFDSTSGTYNARGGSQNDDYLNFSVDVNSSGVFPIFQPHHTYLIYLTVSIESSSPVTFRASTIQHVWGNPSSGLPVRPIIYSSNSYVNSTSTFTVISQVTPTVQHSISTSSRLVIGLNESVQTSGRASWGFYALDVTESSDSEINQIITAINNQTDKIVNGDDSTGGIVSSAYSSKSELESIVSDYQQIENSMLDNFTIYQDEILVDLRGWSWGGLRSCAKWVGDTLTDYYNNLGDFKQYIIYPLLLGIALFFIGRGSSIIGHLYRKPTVTTTYTESTSARYRSGNHSGTNTSTTTYREGGVLRK